MRKCHLNTCPVGVATQDPVLRKKFAGKPEHVVNYLFMVAEDARQIMAELGFRRSTRWSAASIARRRAPRSSIGRPTASTSRRCSSPARKPHESTEVYCTRKQDHGLNLALDNRLIAAAKKSIEQRKKTRKELPIINTNRTVGTILSHEIAKKWGEDALPDDTIHFKFTGSAGQSFGAFLAKGVTLELDGDATTTSARASRAAGSSSIRRPDRTLRGRGQHHHRQRRALRRDERRSVLPRPRRRAVLRPQQRRECRDRRRRRPRLRIHDGRPRRDLGPDRAATSRPACAAASRTSGTRARTSSSKCNTGHGRARSGRRGRGHRRAARADRAAPGIHRLDGRGADPRRVADVDQRSSSR